MCALVTSQPPSIKILVLAANPADTDHLALDVEIREIQSGLRKARHGRQFQVLVEPAVQVGSLQTLMMDHEPTVVHFSGHGTRGEGGVAGHGVREVRHERPETGLLAHDDADAPVLLEAGPLASLFARLGRRVRCVVLNACYSDDLAQALVQHVDCVVGMTAAIDDRAAIAFASSFYETLAFGKSVNDAFEAGKSQIALTRLPGSGVPRLRVRTGASASDIVLAPTDTGAPPHVLPSDAPEADRYLECDRSHAWDYLCSAAETARGHVLFLCGQQHYGHERFVERVRRLAVGDLAQKGLGALILELSRKIFENIDPGADARLAFVDALNKLRSGDDTPGDDTPEDDTVEARLGQLLRQRSVILLYPTVTSAADAAWAVQHYQDQLPKLIRALSPPPAHGLIAVQPVCWQKGTLD